MNTIDEPKEHIQGFWLRYWPVICCPIFAFATWKGPPDITLLFTLLVMREHRQWRGLWGPVICFLICLGSIIASGMSTVTLMIR